MEKKFKVGDKVRINPETTQGMGYFGFRDKDAVVINAWPEKDLYDISIGNKPIWTAASSDSLVLVEPYNATTAFLSELKELLSKYNAEIYVSSDGWDGEVALTFIIGGREYVDYPDKVLSKIGNTITADNLMDYEKE